ncbi:molecular chaperone [Paenibacillus thiaminolyticus]|uniref:molecular chaperone n=1 Tax=Paenibacillus thiaminolyticus TaxID=49283 RepID=UPI002542E673|nr:molecular chaperone [Paenibacillus thiaminolyticus]WII37426.1 molecular chaperone [Paenibacillus thiaminolyticus]
MAGYSYKLYTQPGRREDARKRAQYHREELLEMTTFQLRNICQREKLIEGLIHTLDRDDLIATIMKYRGADESLLITGVRPGGFERVEAVMKKYLGTPMTDTGGIRIPAKITLYSGLKLDQFDGYHVEAGEEIAESNVLLVNENLELCAILNLVKDGSARGSFYLAMAEEAEVKKTANRQYSLLFFPRTVSEYVYRTYYRDTPLPPAHLYYYKIPVTDLDIRELEETDAVLAIDFGTSNTTAGAYLDSGYIASPNTNDVLSGRIRLDRINYVAFPETTSADAEWIEVLPTVIGVADCSDPERIRYHFGYDALRDRKRNGYSGSATVFHGMKRWVNNYKKREDVMDAQGNAASVSRQELIRAYMLHVIRMAEHQFKCRFRHLHLSGPVKLKKQFIEMFADILPEYRIESDDALDEGLAVLYNTIANQMEQQRFLDGEEYKALVIDCGGGTTDLSSCRFRIEDSHIAYKLDIHTSYENGDTNFGGNNITYRIMQFMKIVFAGYYRGGGSMAGTVPDIDSLIDIPAADLYRHVDEFGAEAVYAAFDAAYRETEAVIPTRFKEYEHRSRDEYQRVRNNFYVLWEMADGMKKEFFRRTGILRSRFDSGRGGRAEDDLHLTVLDRWCLSLRENGQFRDMHEPPDVVFNIQEINHLIRADIYAIVHKFLDEFFRDGRLQDYSIIKLTGQSCRIDVFREALKEFVPGRAIEFRQKADDSGRVPELKLACLRGALRYLSARKAGLIEARLTNQAPIVPYSVSALTHTGQEKLLIASYERLDQARGSISRPLGAHEIEFNIRNADGQLRYVAVYANDFTAYRPVRYEEIAAEYGDRIPQDDTDSIANGEAKWFVFAGDGSWGFDTVPVARLNEQLYIGTKQFYAFENDLSELDFFDGLK